MVRPFNPIADDVQQSRLLWPLFELANLEHLCCIARIPVFRHSANEYFRVHFRGKEVHLAAHQRPTDEFFTYFRSSIQKVYISSMDMATFSYVALHFPNLMKITFEDQMYQNINIPIEWADIIKDQMRMVYTVVFNVDQFNRAIYDRLLQHARENIRILIINSTPTPIKSNPFDSFSDDENRWYSQSYPNLSTLQWDDGIVLNALEFHQLLTNNPNIQHLIFTRHIDSVMDFIEEFDLQLHRLDVNMSFQDLPNIERICRRLNEQFENGRFKQLYVTLERHRYFFAHLNTVKGLKGITYHGEYVPEIGECTQLTELTVDSMDIVFDAANQLTTLRTLRINRASIDAIGPLICRAPQLMKIVVETIDVELLDILKLRLLAEQRSRLQNAQRLKIYLEERAYCMLKPYETDHATPLVNVRRIEELLN